MAVLDVGVVVATRDKLEAGSGMHGGGRWTLARYGSVAVQT